MERTGLLGPCIFLPPSMVHVPGPAGHRRSQTATRLSDEREDCHLRDQYHYSSLLSVHRASVGRYIQRHILSHQVSRKRDLLMRNAKFGKLLLGINIGTAVCLTFPPLPPGSAPRRPPLFWAGSWSQFYGTFEHKNLLIKTGLPTKCSCNT